VDAVAQSSKKVKPSVRVHTRESEYPKQVDPAVAGPIYAAAAVPGTNGQKLRSATGAIIDRSEATIEHRNPTVEEHWNSIGRNAPRSVRNAYYQNPKHMTVLSRGENGRLGQLAQQNGAEFRQDVGPNYTRYIQDER
jgi:hypothetical protein